MVSLKKQTVSGVFWSASSKLGVMFVQVILMMILSRILQPDDFGVMGFLSFFSLVGGVIIESGFGQALIRLKNVTQLELSSVFYLNLFLGLLLYLLLFNISDNLSVWFNNPIISEVSKIYFLIIPINALGIIQTTLLNKSLQFKKIAFVSFLAVFISGLLGVYCAFNNYGVWSLVYQYVFYSILNTFFLWIVNKWLPTLSFSFLALKKIFSFSINLLFSGLIIVIFNNLYTLVIGKFYTHAELGYYTQAKRIEEIPSQSLTSIIQNVSYSALAKMQDNEVALRNNYVKIIRQNVFLIAPLLFLGFGVAPNFIPIFLGNNWLPVIPIFQVLCVYGALFPLHSVNINILRIKGHGGLILKLEIIRRLVMVIVLLITIKCDLLVLLIGFVVSSVISILINLYYCGKTIHYSIKEQIMDIGPYYLASFLSMIFIYVIEDLLERIFVFNYLVLLFQIVIFVALYFYMMFKFRLPAYFDFVDICISLTRKLKK